MYQTLQYREDGAVATPQLNRPQKKNSFNAQMRREMEALLHEIAQKPEVRAVIITGGEEIFCAGADIGEIEGTSSAFDSLFSPPRRHPYPNLPPSRGKEHAGHHSP